VFTGARRFNGGVKRQQVRLAGDFFDDGDLARISFMADTASRTDLPLSCASLADLLDLVGLLCVVRVLLDVGAHLLHRGRGLLGRRGLRTGSFRYSTEAVEMDWLAADTRRRWRESRAQSASDAHHRAQRLH